MKRVRVALEVPADLKNQLEFMAAKTFSSVTAYIVRAVSEKLVADSRRLKLSLPSGAHNADEQLVESFMRTSMAGILVAPEYLSLPADKQSHIIEQWTLRNGPAKI